MTQLLDTSTTHTFQSQSKRKENAPKQDPWRVQSILVPTSPLRYCFPSCVTTGDYFIPHKTKGTLRNQIHTYSHTLYLYQLKMFPSCLNALGQNPWKHTENESNIHTPFELELWGTWSLGMVGRGWGWTSPQNSFPTWMIPWVYELGRTRPQDGAALRPQPSTDGSTLTEPRMETKQQGSTKRGCPVGTTRPRHAHTDWAQLWWFPIYQNFLPTLMPKYQDSYVLRCLFDFFFFFFKGKMTPDHFICTHTHAEQGMEQQFRITVRVRQYNCLYFKLPSNRGLALS